MINHMLRQATPQDAAQIAGIYNEYIKNTTITFELEPVSVEEMETRIRQISSRYPYLVYEDGDKIAGYCYAHGWKEKAAYDRTVETTVYLHPSYKHQGIGSRLMDALVKTCREKGFHNLIACITEENEESAAFHKRLGFRQASHFHEVGYKFGRWIGIVDYELIV